MTIPQDKFFRDMMTYYGIPSAEAASRSVVNVHNHHHHTNHYSCDRQHDGRSSRSERSESASSQLPSVVATGLAAGAVGAILAQSATTRTNAQNSSLLSSQVSLFDKNAHLQELGRINSIEPQIKGKVANGQGTQDERLADEIVDKHKEIVEENCAKAAGLRKSGFLFTLGMAGMGILQSRALQNNGTAQTILKVATFASMASSLGVFCMSGMFKQTRLPEHYTTAIRRFAYSFAPAVPANAPPYQEAAIPSAPYQPQSQDPQREKTLMYETPLAQAQKAE
jgi:hypothetical protein